MSEWNVVEKWKNKPQGQVWRVRDAKGRTGFFKFAYPHQWHDAGPIVGNEWLARQLASRLGLPSASLECATVREAGHELRGIVSLPRQGTRLVSWRSLPSAVHQQPERYIVEWERMVQTVAYDVWLTNIDRGSGENIMLYRKDSGRWHWYLIDHGYTLYGCDRKWVDHPQDSLHWRRVWRFYHIPRGWQRLARRPTLMAMARKIAALPARDIRACVEAVPDILYSPGIKSSVLELLLTRQKTLPGILDAWLRYKGNKEFRL